ncbi:type I phosphomannose isomerase catalytic subunit [Gillisia limnaea]|uniref:Phosphohexomutase n=1 Tax=Gillisia limnaea (strain DSM 15749 / LMG 21470 / R-8282) TaxID=865937 RepID=H2BU52_GILLR|nr:type I phosphomannose isomerase catalytic subunit [Gillisia limnaea]EHQ01648.1 mannose-6-phosphate isomerase, type 1 [Gillisia limnaea DSM 15749]
MKKCELYLLRFDPILKEKVWGGKKLKQLFNKNSPSDETGESWEISDVEGSGSIVSNGKFKGRSLKWLMEEYNTRLVGEKVFDRFGTKFPLLIKFIDAAENLSVQLHPNDEIAQKRHNSFGKTEMWYIMQADKDAELILGFKEVLTEQKYIKLVETNKLLSALNSERVQVGDSFIIKPGLVHAIGAGVVLAEIQQTSDITYRIYDWDRTSDSGEKRELHTDLALEAIDLSKNRDFRINFDLKPNQSSEIITTRYFKTNIIQLESTVKRDYSSRDSFVILMGVEGEAIVKHGDNREVLKQGESILIPAEIHEITIEGINSKILEVSL